MTTNETSLAITCLSALIGPELRLVYDAVVVVEGEKIIAAGAARDIEVPADCETFDAPITLMPGFIDAHVHIGFYPPAEVLAGGVTTARDLGWPPHTIVPLVEQSNSVDFDGPTLLAAGPMLTVAGGYPTRAGWAPPGTGRVVKAAGDAADAVDEIAESGAAVIKVALNAAAGPTLDAATLSAVTEAAARHRLRVTAHITGLDELRKAVDAGVSELAHMLMSRERIPDELIARMVEREITVVPTLSVRSGRDRKLAIENLRRWLEAGGRVVYGTDLGNAGPRPGIDRREVRAMAEASMSPHDIAVSATAGAAEWLGLPHTGAIEAGRDADLVGVAGAPMDDANDLCDVRFVMRKGRTFP